MGKIVEGRWDCPYCNTTLIRGRYRHCPNCGKGRGPETKFYIDDMNDVVSNDVPEKGPDWMCEYCNSYAPFSAKFCPNCGAEKGSKDYFQIRHELERKQQSVHQSKNKTGYDFDEDDSYPTSYEDDFEEESSHHTSYENDFQEKSSYHVSYESNSHERQSRSIFSNVVDFLADNKKILFIGAIIIALITMLVIIFIPHNETIIIKETHWDRSIEVESYEWVDESGWTLPSGGKLQRTSWEIHHYDHVLDHYETVSVPHQETYVSGYRTVTRDLGNGYFDVSEEPVYSTRTVYTTEQKAVYRDDPVYATKYYYKIQRWVYNRTYRSSGNTDPYWPEVKLASSNEREGSKSQHYTVTAENKKSKTKTYSTPYEIWTDLRVGQTIEVVVSAGTIIEIVNGTK